MFQFNDIITAFLISLMVCSSFPGHAIFACLIPIMGAVVQMHFPNSSPVDEYPANMWIFIVCLLIYGSASLYDIRCKMLNIANPTCLKLSIKVAIISGALAYASLISVLVPRVLEPIVFIICLLSLFLYFTHNTMKQICENLYNEWAGNEGNENPRPTPNLPV